MKIGIVFDLKEDYNIKSENTDYHDFCFLSEAEAAYNNLSLLGHDVTYIGNPVELLKKIKTSSLDCEIIYNIAEGYKSRNREGIVPSVCEAYGIPYTGTDAFGLSLSLHKYQMSCFLKSYNISVPKDLIFTPNLDKIDELDARIKTAGIDYPIILKPNHEGSSMGVNLVKNNIQLKSALIDCINRFCQEILIQEYIPGMELSTCILGTGNNAHIYGSVEYKTLFGEDIELFTEQLKINGNHQMAIPRLDKKILNEIEAQALYIHRVLDIKDISRIDWRFDFKKNKPFFIELTPLPDLSAGTEFDWIAGWKKDPYSQVFAEIIKSASLRYKINPN